VGENLKHKILTNREQEIFEKLIKNESTKMIALELKISEKTDHLHQVFAWH
jgi:FixJ family two-component response regulator